MILKTVLLSVLCSFAANNGNLHDIQQSLMLKGFPQDYAVRIAPLKQKFPSWKFKPLAISKLNPQYSWKYVLHMETDAAPARSLIAGNTAFAAYFHPTDKKLYDAGCHRASTDAVAYFLDPRNFLNERDIFQFENLNAPDEFSTSAVDSMLAKTFMHNAVLENGKSYTQYFCELGKLFNIDPLFLASRAKQEQGIAGTPLISGKCGSLLNKYFQQKTQTVNNLLIMTPEKYSGENDLKKYDGLYNFFNINASGNGRFSIYLNGMKEAAAGTPAMAGQWNSPAWNTKWKSIYGGALKIAGKYINNYQNTRYLQKWNIDPRSKNSKGESRNFWGQYMQNIGAAFSEASAEYNALKKENLLHLPYDFLIPVFDEMPQAPSPDPAQGKCIYFKTFSPLHKAVPSSSANTEKISGKSAQSTISFPEKTGKVL